MAFSGLLRRGRQSSRGNRSSQNAALFWQALANLIDLKNWSPIPTITPEEVEAFVAKFRPNFAEATRNFVRSMFVATSDPALVEKVALGMSSAPPSVALPSLESAFSYSREMPRTLEQLRLPVIAINPDNAPTDVASLERCGV